jgi:hypothetical protein
LRWSGRLNHFLASTTSFHVIKETAMCATHAMKRVGALGTLATGLVLVSFGTVRAAERPVDWTNQVNVTARGNTLQKTGGCQGCEDAGAVSRQMIRAGDGYVEFRVGETNTFWLAGLGRGDDNTRYNDIDFAFRFNGAGQADVMENGVYQSGGDTAYTVGDVFRIAVVGGRVQYSKNGRVLRESQKAPEYPLHLDTALGSSGATIQNARIEANEQRLTRFDSPSDRFADLDANNDGVVAFNEWPGARRAFDRRDVNGDGVLTPRELRPGEAGGVATSGEIVRVDAAQPWTRTGLYVNAGDAITLDAEGTIRLSRNADDTANPIGSRSGRRAGDAPMRQAAAGSLIARIGDSGPMLVGDRRTITAPVSGELYLGVNDDHVLDNSGEYRVAITIG